jgi:hypothetical protein
MALEQLTNPRVRDEVGDIALVPPEERVSGPGASYVMAAFTHVNPKGSRFSDGSFGVYYVAAALETARSQRPCSISRHLALPGIADHTFTGELTLFAAQAGERIVMREQLRSRVAADTRPDLAHPGIRSGA